MDQPSGIGAAQRRIVDHLKRSGPCSTADLAQRVAIFARHRVDQGYMAEVERNELT